MLKRSLVLGAICTAAVGIGCGSSGGISGIDGAANNGGGGTNGGGGNNGGGFTTSVSGSKMLSGLSPADQTQLCSDGQHYVTTTVAPAQCKELGLLTALELSAANSSTTDAQLQAACTSGYNGCVTDLANPDGGAPTCNFAALTSGNCTATVAELAACLSDTGRAEAQVASAIPSCSTLTSASLNAAVTSGGDAGNPANPPSCVTLDTKCPGAMGSMSTTTN
jgi:hypothetical protein